MGTPEENKPSTHISTLQLISDIDANHLDILIRLVTLVRSNLLDGMNDI